MEKMKKKEKVMHRFFVLLLAVMTVSVFGAVPVRAEDNSQQYETEVLAQTNRERISVGLPPLTTFGSIEQSADVRAKEIAEYFSHERPDGTDCFTAIEVLWPNTAGENIARAYPTPLSVVDGWMNSPGHRANILNEEFTHLSVGYYEASSRNWVQMFLGTCKFDAMSLSTNEVTVNQGTSLAAQNITVYMHCAKHGTSTMPLTDEMVIGFNSQVTGSQQVTVRYSDSLTAALTVNVRHEHTWSCAHDGSSHWLVCDCGEVKDTAKHDWSRKDGTCAICGLGCTHGGVKTGTCKTCGAFLGAADISRGALTLSQKSWTYTGKAVRPGVTVKYGSTTLKANTDYTVQYSGNTNPGTARVTVLGKGNYKGTLTANFTISVSVGKVSLGSVRADSSAKVTLSWNAVSGATGYRVFRKTGSSGWKILKTVNAGTKQCADTAVRAGTKYTYTVRAYRTVNGKIYWGDYDRTGLSVTPPMVGTVKLGSIKASSSTKVTLSWNTVSGATGYRIYRRTGSGSWKTLKTVTVKTRQYTDTTAKAGTKYTYTVRAYKRASGKTYWGSYDKKGLTAVTPKAAVKVGTVKLGSIKANSSAKVTLSWNTVSGATGYRIYRKTGNGSWTALRTVNAKIRRFTDTTAKAGTKYTYTVRAYRRVNGRIYWGSYNKKGLTVTTPKK